MAIDFATETTLRALSPALTPLSTEATQQQIFSAINDIDNNVKLCDDYLAITETIGTDKTYTVAFLGRAMELYCDKAVDVLIKPYNKTVFGDPIQLPANIGINVRHLGFYEVRLESVPANTVVRLIILGG